MQTCVRCACLRRAVDQDGMVLDILLQNRPDKGCVWTIAYFRDRRHVPLLVQHLGGPAGQWPAHRTGRHRRSDGVGPGRRDDHAVLGLPVVVAHGHAEGLFRPGDDLGGERLPGGGGPPQPYPVRDRVGSGPQAAVDRRRGREVGDTERRHDLPGQARAEAGVQQQAAASGRQRTEDRVVEAVRPARVGGVPEHVVLAHVEAELQIRLERRQRPDGNRHALGVPVVPEVNNRTSGASGPVATGRPCGSSPEYRESSSPKDSCAPSGRLRRPRSARGHCVDGTGPVLLGWRDGPPCPAGRQGPADGSPAVRRDSHGIAYNRRLRIAPGGRTTRVRVRPSTADPNRWRGKHTSGARIGRHRHPCGESQCPGFLLPAWFGTNVPCRSSTSCP